VRTSVTEDDYGALLRQVCEFCGREAACSGISDDPILHRELPYTKNRSDAMGDFKN
jgi:hypothetical protein